jgi:hypothetical protein
MLKAKRLRRAEEQKKNESSRIFPTCAIACHKSVVQAAGVGSVNSEPSPFSIFTVTRIFISISLLLS